MAFPADPKKGLSFKQTPHEGRCVFVTDVSKRSQKRITNNEEFQPLVFMVQTNVRITDHH